MGWGISRMPPPLRCASLIPLSSTCSRQCYRAPSRAFSSTAQRDQRITRNRRLLFTWLASTGANFYEPAERSTNYLSAYTAEGVLRRSNKPSRDDKEKDGKDDKDAESGAGEKKRIPKEAVRDLRPFPQNQQFQSQAVLSEAIRETIWESIMLEGKSVRDVSSDMSVEMSRVGAVVRLMEIEKEWKRIVRHFPSFSPLTS